MSWSCNFHLVKNREDGGGPRRSRQHQMSSRPEGGIKGEKNGDTTGKFDSFAPDLIFLNFSLYIFVLGPILMKKSSVNYST
jgi:hypothetical protein